MYRRAFIAGLACTTALAACEGGVGPIKLLHNLVFAFLNVTGLLPSIPGINQEAINRVKDLLAQAQYLLDKVIDTVSDASKSVAQKILSLILAAMDVIAPIAQATQPFNSIIAAARIMIPVIAGLFGIAIGVPTRLAAEEAKYPVMSEQDAEATLARYAQ